MFEKHQDWTGQAGTGRDGTGRDRTGRDGTGRDGTLSKLLANLLVVVDLVLVLVHSIVSK